MKITNLFENKKEFCYIAISTVISGGISEIMIDNFFLDAAFTMILGQFIYKFLLSIHEKLKNRRQTKMESFKKQNNR